MSSIALLLTGATGAGVAAAAYPAWREWREALRDEARVKHGLQQEVKPASARFAPEMVEGLPEPARRYLLHAIRPGAPLATSLRLVFKGTVQYGPDSRKWPLEGSDILIVPGRGFHWRESNPAPPFSRHGFLYYYQDAGRVSWSRWNLIRDVGKLSYTGPDTTRSLAARFASKYFWIPTALLPQAGVTWEAVDASHVRARMQVGLEPVVFTLEVNPEGRLKSVTYPRWGAKNADGSYSYFPFGHELEGEATFGDYTIPLVTRALWCYGTEDRKPPLIHEYRIQEAVYS